ncbi:MAG: thrombospondin type 3 repeat-containing protein, partial [Deltaproteobacteria bacterium]|nr:thrombospondin type 3 repeat-containing protein [Deltaproteobacteria bacterium]
MRRRASIWILALILCGCGDGLETPGDAAGRTDTPTDVTEDGDGGWGDADRDLPLDVAEDPGPWDGMDSGEEDLSDGGTGPDGGDAGGDGEGDVAGDAPAPGDQDEDGVPDAKDNCPGDWNEGQEDLDGDGQGNACDSDLDGDGYPNIGDTCPTVAHSLQADTDGDGLGDICD